MAIHFDRKDLLKESLLEMIYVSESCITHRKSDYSIWGENTTGGILGFPATVIIFSIIDCIGSIFSGNDNYKIIIDKKQRSIKDTSQHIYILNSSYFSLDLEKQDLDNLYKNVRSTLTHNSLLPQGYFLETGETLTTPIQIAITETNHRIYRIGIIPLFSVTKIAVANFIKDLDNDKIDYNNSKVFKILNQRDSRFILQSNPSKPNEHQIIIKKWVKE